MDAAGMKIVSLQSGNWEIEKGNAVASAMLNEHPDLKRCSPATTAWPSARYRRCARRAAPGR